MPVRVKDIAEVKIGRELRTGSASENGEDTVVGTALMRHAEAHIFRTGPNVFLTVSHFNRRAQAFYRARGYRKVGDLPAYVVPGITEVLYRKTRGAIRLRAR